MKPVRLEFKGFNSFSEKTVIDFSELLSGNLFGIFGKTGSGKSTILDCIMYALFAKTSRSQTLKEYVNNKSDGAYVDFTFEILNAGERKTYNVRRSIKINKRNQPETAATLAEIKNGAAFPMDEGDINGKIKEIIGIGFEEFSKCIILPQNEFAAFVKSTRAVRLGLVCKLFSLEKYDTLLLKALKTRKNAEELRLSGIEGELLSYGEYTAERLEKLNETLAENKRALEKTEREEKAISEKLSSGAQLYSYKLREIENTELLNALKNKSAKIKNIRIRLEKYSAARVVASAGEEYNKSVLELNKAQAAKARLDAERTKAAAEYAHVNELLKEDRNGEISEISENIGLMKANKNVVEEIAVLIKDYRARNGEAASLNDKKSRLLREIEGISKKITDIGNPDGRLEKLFGEVGASAVRTEIKEQIDYLTAEKTSIKKYENENLYSIVTEKIDRRIEYLLNKIENLAAAETDTQALITSLNKIKEDNALLARYREELSMLKSDITVTESKIALNDAEAKRLLEEGKRKREILNGISNKVSLDVSTVSKFSSALLFLENRKQTLQNELARLTERSVQLADWLSSAKDGVASAKASVITATGAAAEKSEQLKQALSAGGFESQTQALSFVLDEKTVAEYNNTVEEYDRDLNYATAQANELSRLLNGGDFDINEYENLKASAELKVKEKQGILSAVAVIESSIAETKNKIERAAEIIKRRTEVSARLSLCEKLEKVLSNHNLLNFIAEEYLSEISAGASRTLLMLTGGRYDLIYDGEFYVLDNLNCGERRSVSTLSGGETFLVSLSLALSLSQAICNKTNRPVEFFFLDEGFGTLDAELTDVVIDSLEKLRGEHFAIGLISHVPELKQRIQTKILVTGATAYEGSKIEVIS